MLLEGFAEREPDGAADGVEIARGEGDWSDTCRVSNRLAAVEEIQDLERDAHAMRPRLSVGRREAA